MKLLSFLSTIALLFIVVFVTPQAQAFEMQNGDSIRIEKDRVVEGSLFAAGSSVVIDGVVHGDVYCVGQQVTITGSVDGDVICAGQSFFIDGLVDGSLRLVGQNVQVSGRVRRNASIVSQSFTLLPKGVISGEVLSAGESMNLEGLVEKTVMSAYRIARFNGLVGGDMRLAVDTLTLGEKATVSGAIEYTSDNPAVISKMSSVSGTVVRKVPPKTEHKPVVKNTPVRSWPASAWPSIVFFLIISCLMVALFPKYMARASSAMTKDGVPVGLKGAVILMATPVVLFFVFITIIGIPFSIALFMLYCMAIGISRVFVAGIVGAFILEKFDVKQKANMFIQMLVGVPVLWFIFKMPFLGGLVGFLAVCWGLGGMYTGFKTTKK